MLGIDSSYGSEDKAGVWGQVEGGISCSLNPSGEVITGPLARKEQPHKTGNTVASAFKEYVLGRMWAFEVLRDIGIHQIPYFCFPGPILSRKCLSVHIRDVLSMDPHYTAVQKLEGSGPGSKF